MYSNLLNTNVLYISPVDSSSEKATRCAPGDARRNALVVRLVQLNDCVKRSMMGTTDSKCVLLLFNLSLSFDSV